jgi:HEAT repeat protein
MQTKLGTRLGVWILVAIAATGFASATSPASTSNQHGGPSQGGKPKPGKGAGGSYSGPGDTLPGGGNAGGKAADTVPTGQTPPDAPAGGRRPAAGALPPNAPQGPTSPFLPATVAGEASSDANWWMWWEFNKTEFLRPNRLQVKLGLRTGIETERERAELVQAMLDQLRGAVGGPLSRALASNDALERAEAVGAFGRMAGPTSVEALLAALGDPSVVVRDRAILALGAIATEPSFAALSRIAETGTVRDGVEISGNARPLAIAALAIGRRTGFDDRADRLVERVVRSWPAGIGDRLAVCAMIYQTVAPCAVLEKLAFDLARDDGVSMPVRFAREALIARIAGDAVDRPWAALGLGLLVRANGDIDALVALRKAAAAERNLDGRPAFWIALGLARDVGSVGALAGEVASNSDPVRQHYAASALALIGDPTAHDALAARLALEKKPFPRVVLSAALGFFGRAADVASLAESAKALRQPDLQTVVSMGLAYVGAIEAVDPLSARLAAKDSGAIVRAGACAALGLLLSRNEPLILARASWSSNYTVYEVWMDELVQSTL